MKQLLILFFGVLSFHTGIAQQKDSVVNNFFEQMGKGNWTGAMAYMLWIVHFDKRGLGEIRQVMIDMGIAEHKLARWPFNRAVSV